MDEKKSSVGEGRRPAARRVQPKPAPAKPTAQPAGAGALRASKSARPPSSVPGRSPTERVRTASERPKARAAARPARPQAPATEALRPKRGAIAAAAEAAARAAGEKDTPKPAPRARVAGRAAARPRSARLETPGLHVDLDGVEEGGEAYVPEGLRPSDVEVLSGAPTSVGDTRAIATAEDADDDAHDAADVSGQLEDIERSLDRLLNDAGTVDGDPVARRRAADALSQIAARLGGSKEAPPEDADDILSTARDMLSTDFYLKQWGRLAMRNRSEEVDDFGLDPAYEARLLPLFELLYRRYFRIETTGIADVPREGRVLVVANHGGTLPWDGVMLKMAFKLEPPKPRELRWLAEDFIFHFPFVGAFMNRIGAVRACPENAERLLANDKLVAVFPEGIKGMGKLYKQRYQLQRFGRGGYVKLALRTGTPLVPCAIVGAEDTNPMFFRLEYLAKLVSLPYLPVTPTFPALGPLGLAPLPSKWHIRFGEPLDLSGYGADAAEDAVLVNRLNEKVRTTVQSLVDASLASRRSAFS